jgi:hypothetical protein
MLKTILFREIVLNQIFNVFVIFVLNLEVGMKKLRLMWSFVICICFLTIVSGQKGSLSVKVDKDTLYQDEVIKVEFLLDNLSGNFIAPDFNGFRMVSGPNTSSSFSMINGVVTQKKAYSYVLMPEATGDQQIGGAIVSTDEDKLITDPVSVYVLSTDKLSPSSKSRQRVYKYDTPGMTKDTSTKAPIKKRVLKKI